MKSKVFVFDLDGTLCFTPENENGPQYYEAEPLRDRIEKVNNLYDEGHIIIIDSARGNTSGKNWFYVTLKQLKSWGLKFHTLRTGVKLTADVYVDEKAINAEEFFSKESKKDVIKMSIEDYLKKESGGKTKVMLVNRVYKEATDERMEKLVDEIQFIQNIPNRFKKFFPEIIYWKEDKNRNVTYYEMRHYPLPSMRRLLLSDRMNVNQALYWCEKALKIIMEMLKYEIIPMPDNCMNYMHFDRLERRLNEIKVKSLIFREILKKKFLFINGKRYINIPQFIPFLKEKVAKDVLPPFVGRWDHSDLHFSNILIDEKNDTVLLVDPRGYPFCDYYYDYGKYWHSVNGKYEFIAEGLFELEEGHFEIHKNKAFYIFEEIKEKLPKILFKYSDEKENDVMRKTEFNECIHFASLIPFVLDFDGVEKRALCAYYTATILLTQFVEKYYSLKDVI